MSDIKIPDVSNRLTFQGLMSNRRFLILALMAVVGTAFYLNWGWLAAIGAAPLILAVAPCAVMCGFGVCAMCKSDSCDKKGSAAEPSQPGD